jgi:hypothetical protein
VGVTLAQIEIQLPQGSRAPLTRQQVLHKGHHDAQYVACCTDCAMQQAQAAPQRRVRAVYASPSSLEVAVSPVAARVLHACHACHACWVTTARGGCHPTYHLWHWQQELALSVAPGHTPHHTVRQTGALLIRGRHMGRPVRYALLALHCEARASGVPGAGCAPGMHSQSGTPQLNALTIASLPGSRASSSSSASVMQVFNKLLLPGVSAIW